MRTCLSRYDSHGASPLQMHFKHITSLSQPVTGSHNQVETSHITLILLWWHTVWQSLFEVCWRESCVQKWLAAWATIVKIAKRRGGKKTRKEAKILMWSNLVNRRKKQYEGGCENQNNNKNQKQLTYLLQARLKPPRNSGTECHPVCLFFYCCCCVFLLLPREHHLVSSRPRHCAGANLAVHFGSSTHRFSVNCPR